ncbi:MAG: hypothetical protein H6709_16505 [Kofleriaceae bacterium]|nr:hypothetical protein [Kofleriaceae bacterium]
MARTVVGLAALVLAIALGISRLGLIAHELVGHGVTARLAGGHVTGWRLHLFGGGWLGYRAEPPLRGAAGWLVQLGGIGVELTLAAALAALWAASPRLRAAPTAALAVTAAAWALATHAAWYLAAGTYHGFGDGWGLHQALGADRLGLAGPVAAAGIAAALVGGRAVGRRLRALTPTTTPRRQLIAIAVAVALGGGAHAALTAGELAVRRDRTYHAVMQTEGQRATARELAARASTPPRAPASRSTTPRSAAPVATSSAATAASRRSAPRCWPRWWWPYGRRHGVVAARRGADRGGRAAAGDRPGGGVAGGGAGRGARRARAVAARPPPPGPPA